MNDKVGSKSEINKFYFNLQCSKHVDADLISPLCYCGSDLQRRCAALERQIRQLDQEKLDLVRKNRELSEAADQRLEELSAVRRDEDQVRCGSKSGTLLGVYLSARLKDTPEVDL